MSLATVRQHGSIADTDGVRVEVAPQYVPEQSDPEGSDVRPSLYVFAYQIRIINQSSERVKLLSRHWEIVDADGERKIVEGDGVIGQQPELDPGDSHRYASFCPLHTPWGTMEGYFVMQTVSGRRFQARVGRFFLDSKPTD
jgi:ApaG protein